MCPTAHLGDLHIVKTLRPVFRNSDTSLRTKRLVYCAMMLGMLIHVYGVKTWDNKRVKTRKGEAVHNRCLR